ncbi:MAG: serine/threonine protein kinase [Deltaproteobacteria bacterium]|nr:serine/threonine protein kinase [Deltaproteobacteria bacterium]
MVQVIRMEKRRTIGYRYLLSEQIGEGAVATIWRAFDLVEDRSVAIKLLKDVLDPEDAARLQMEVAIVARLRHPNIIRFLDQGVTDRGRRYVVMELLEGESLRDRLRSDLVFSIEEGVPILIQMVSALYEAHKANVVHRDVKPENVFLVFRPGCPLVKLLDFGMAKVMGGGGPSLTMSGVLFGTPHYMAPERIRGEEARPASDVYSAAIIAFEMFCARRPFDGKSAEDVMRQHLLGHPPRPCRHIPKKIAGLIQDAMSSRPEHRPTSAQMLAALGAAFPSSSPAIPDEHEDEGDFTTRNEREDEGDFTTRNEREDEGDVTTRNEREDDADAADPDTTG